jgi:hypothetical protein
MQVKFHLCIHACARLFVCVGKVLFHYLCSPFAILPIYCKVTITIPFSLSPCSSFTHTAKAFDPKVILMVNCPFHKDFLLPTFPSESLAFPMNWSFVWDDYLMVLGNFPLKGLLIQTVLPCMETYPCSSALPHLQSRWVCMVRNGAS